MGAQAAAGRDAGLGAHAPLDTPLCSPRRVSHSLHPLANPSPPGVSSQGYWGQRNQSRPGWPSTASRPPPHRLLSSQPQLQLEEVPETELGNSSWGDAGAPQDPRGTTSLEPPALGTGSSGPSLASQTPGWRGRLGDVMGATVSGLPSGAAPFFLAVASDLPAGEAVAVLPSLTLQPAARSLFGWPGCAGPPSISCGVVPSLGTCSVRCTWGTRP